MKIKKLNIFALIGLGFGIGSALTLTGCADEMTVSTPDAPVDGIVLRIPNIEAATEFSSRATSEVAAAEGSLSDLWLVVFKQDASGWKKVKCDDLSSGITKVSSGQYSSYSDYKLDLEAGNYKFYLLGNLLSYLPSNYSYSSSINSEEDIFNLNLGFSGDLTAGKLPMVSLSKIKTSENATSEEGSSVAISATDMSQGKVIYADLSFLCSKVRYTVLLDKNDFSSSFIADRTLEVGNNVAVGNVVKTTPVDAPLSAWDNQYLSGSVSASIASKAYPAEINANSSSLDLGGVSSASDSKRAWQGVVYLPENTNVNGKTNLTLALDYVNPNSLEGKSSSTKLINLLPSASEGGNLSSNEGIARGMMYDVILKVKEYKGPADKPDPIPEPEPDKDALQVNVSAWTPQDILVDFTHTYLTLERTSASVTSLSSDVITYNTDGRGITAACFSSDNGGLKYADGNKDYDKPVIVLSALTNNTMTFSVNPEINVAELMTESDGTITGQAHCYITAGNIQKRILIDYDLSPFFTVTPVAVKIQYDANNAASNTKEFVYSTNLGGIKLFTDGATSTGNGLTLTGQGYKTSDGKVTLKCDNPTAQQGKIIVTANSNPGTTLSYEFDAYPQSQPKNITFKEDLTVTVMPPYGDYYIYFRAINDYQSPKYDHDNDGDYGYEETYEFLGGADYLSDSSKWPAEGSKNWVDWWNEGNGSDENPGYHKIYVYGQEGEKLEPSQKVNAWEFVGSYDEDHDNSKTQMQSAGSSNTGWYVYVLDHTLTKDNHPLEPGKTLMIFYNGVHTGKGYHVHRAPHHNDAGIPLFDFEDREGWVLYDPTMEPYYRIYDDKPTIVDAVYTIYTAKPITGWYKVYGIADNNTRYQQGFHEFTIWYNGTKSTQKGNWYETKIMLKAPVQDYSKGIKLKISGSSDEPTLFDGKAYPNNTGYYDDNGWHKGTPSGI